MLAAGGIFALQYATIIVGLPFAFVLILVMWGLFRSLRDEGRKSTTGARGIVAAARRRRTGTVRGQPQGRGRPGWRGR